MPDLALLDFHNRFSQFPHVPKAQPEFILAQLTEIASKKLEKIALLFQRNIYMNPSCSPTTRNGYLKSLLTRASFRNF